MAEEWIYGVNPVTEALRSGRHIKKILTLSGRRDSAVFHILKEADKMGISVEPAGIDFFNNNFPKGHQGVAARVLSRASVPLEDLLRQRRSQKDVPLFIVLDCIEDPRNLGAIARAADAAGADGIILQHHRSAGPGPEAAKASAGAIEYVPLTIVANIKHAIYKMKEQGITIIGIESGRYPLIWETDLTSPIAVVMGSEGKGMRKTVRDKCDVIASIPMRGKVNSLNVSVAAGIVLFEILRQRGKRS